MIIKNDNGDYAFFLEHIATDSIKEILKDAKKNNYVSIHVKLYHGYDFSSLVHMRVQEEIANSGINVLFV